MAADRLHGSGLDGDGVAAGASVLHVQGTVIERSARAGVASFGSAVTIGGTTLKCNSIQLAQQSYEMLPASFIDVCSNHCGCGELQEPCKALSSSLEPPEPVE